MTGIDKEVAETLALNAQKRIERKQRDYAIQRGRLSTLAQQLRDGRLLWQHVPYCEQCTRAVLSANHLIVQNLTVPG